MFFFFSFNSPLFIKSRSEQKLQCIYRRLGREGGKLEEINDRGKTWITNLVHPGGIYSVYTYRSYTSVNDFYYYCYYYVNCFLPQNFKRVLVKMPLSGTLKNIPIKLNNIYIYRRLYARNKNPTSKTIKGTRRANNI